MPRDFVEVNLVAARLAENAITISHDIEPGPFNFISLAPLTLSL
jgi:hypothetical protein